MKTKKEELEAELTRLNALRKQVKEKLKALPLLDVGKWYKGNVDIESLIFITEIENAGDYNRIHGYGFKGCQWNDSSHLFSNTDHEKSLVESTPQEVEKALIEEAKRRYKVGDRLSKIRDDHADDNRFFEIDSFSLENNCLYFNSKKSPFYSYCVFQDGQWATIIEQDKFAELKEAHRNGSVIQWRREKFGNLIWEDCNENEPAWADFNDYRIKPEEKPKVGDVVKCWYNDSPTEFLIKIADEEDLTIFPNIKVITQQEAINLLFNKGAN